MQHLLLLHGALGARDQFDPLVSSLDKNCRVHTLNFSGHGGQAFADRDFSIPLFADNVLDYLHKHDISRVNIFGYSMGGYVGIHLAKYSPEKVNKLITLATKYHWDEATAAKEVKMLDPATILQKIPAFADQLEKRHAPHDWKLLLEKTKELLLGLGRNNALKPGDYSSIMCNSLLLLGDRDKMISLDETVAVYKELPNAQLGILPATPHPFEQVDIHLLSILINRFLR